MCAAKPKKRNQIDPTLQVASRKSHPSHSLTDTHTLTQTHELRDDVPVPAVVSCLAGYRGDKTHACLYICVYHSVTRLTGQAGSP
jgi:hypothetical protein